MYQCLVYTTNSLLVSYWWIS